MAKEDNDFHVFLRFFFSFSFINCSVIFFSYSVFHFLFYFVFLTICGEKMVFHFCYSFGKTAVDNEKKYLYFVYIYSDVLKLNWKRGWKTSNSNQIHSWSIFECVHPEIFQDWSIYFSHFLISTSIRIYSTA